MSGSEVEIRDFSHLSPHSVLQLKSNQRNGLYWAPLRPRLGGDVMRLVLTIAAFLGVLYLFYTAISLLGAVAVF